MPQCCSKGRRQRGSPSPTAAGVVEGSPSPMQDWFIGIGTSKPLQILLSFTKDRNE